MKPSRKELLQRKHKGLTILPGWITAFEEATKDTISPDNFLDLDKTKELRTKFFDHVRNFEGKPRFASNCDLGILKSGLQNRFYQGENLEVILFHSMEKYIGALLTQANVILKKLEAIWRVAEEDLCVATLDLASGFCLERNYYDSNGGYFPAGLLELTSWGKFAG